MQAPELKVSQWFNAKEPITLSKLRGKVIVIEAFQMLCPGCVIHGLPLAQKIRSAFRPEDVEVLGLHTVFEHHDAMTPVSLEAFLHEYRIAFPVGVDEAGESGMPKTMQAYGMRGTPSLIVIDRAGDVRLHLFGEVSEMKIGAQIATLLAEKAPDQSAISHGKTETSQGCDESGCRADA